MFGKRFGIAILSVVTMFTTLAVAQESKNELGGAIGRIFISDQGITGATFTNPTIHSGNGLTWDVEYSRRFLVTPVFAVSAEALFVWNKDEDISAAGKGIQVVPQQYGEIFVTPGVRANLFPTTAVSPWVSVGGGFGHISESSKLTFGAPNPGKSTTSGVLEAGAGLDVKIWPKVYLRGEARDFWAGAPDFPLAPTGKTRQHNIFVAGGVYVRF